MFEVFEAERAVLIPYRGPSDSFRATVAAVSKTCLVSFDGNKYSVNAKAVGRPVDVLVYAERICRCPERRPAAVPPDQSTVK